MSVSAPADLLIQNAAVITFDAAGTVVEDGAVVIAGGRIVDVGPTVEVAPRWEPTRRIHAGGRIVSPGLIDAHFHTGQTLMRGVLTARQKQENLRVPTWREYLVPFENALTPEDVHLSGLLAYASMLLNGTTTFFEAGGPHPERMAAAALETGIRGSVALSTMDGGSRLPSSSVMATDEALKRNVELVETLPPATDGSTRVFAGMALRQIIACSPELIVDIHQEATKRSVKVHTHLVEGSYEIDYCLERFGRRPIEYLIDLGVFDGTLHAAHSIMADDADIDRYVAHRTSACHCPKGNYTIGAAPALRMWRRGVDIGLGTDGVVNYGTLDLFRIAAMASVAQQFLEATPVHNRNGVRADEPLRMAVTGGARAMGLADHIGSIEPGRRADLVVLRTDGPDAAGYDSAEAFFFECASGRDIDTVLVDGEVVVSGGELLTVDLAEIHQRAADRQRRLCAELF
ncbi:amidohydrolase family protein [Pseudonocardia kujensis]|uniref:amidohydrolase family protein n=1 Tax=Pseudonocardia kujensis TaxID=1128675 RepID=UPI001E65DAA0|nr:amidohydrolase family protein [Pseudonocardia kujensis]MCE0764929.1 amidohydrolase family protein [Pseudonocardia kujensis]